MLGAGKIYAVGDSEKKNSLIVCHRVFISLYFQSIKQNYDKYPFTSLI
jgi:hypothetical protein